MGIKISERVKEHLLEWDETRGDLLLKEYQESTSLNPSNNEYKMELVATKKVGGSDFISIYDFSSSTVTTISVVDTFYKLAMVSNLKASKGFISESNGKITKVGNGYNYFKIEANISLQSTNNQDIMVSFFKNGSRVFEAECDTTTSSGGKGSTIPIQCLLELNDGDYIEVFVKNGTSTSNVTLNHINIMISELT